MDIGPIVFGPKDDLISWLRTKKLLASSQDCSFCGTAMREGHRSDVSDGVVWRCPQCKRTKSIREGSFFSKSRLPLQKWLLLIHYWSKEFPVKYAADDTEIHKNTACDMYRWLREVCSTKLLQTPIVLGGRGVIVQIDESLFRYKVKASLKYTIAILQHLIKHLTCSIIMVDHQTQKSGCLGWLTCPTLLPWGLCRSFPREMQPRCCQ